MLPTYKTADISTSHITESDSKLLSEFSKDGNAMFPVIEYEYGFFIPVPPEEVWEDHDVEKKLKEQGFSEMFIQLIKTCIEEDLRLLNLDCDAAITKELPASSW